LYTFNGRRPLVVLWVCRGLVFVTLPSLALVIAPGTFRDAAHVAKVASRYVTSTTYLNAAETQDVAQGGGLAGSICGVAAPGWYKVLCLLGPIWAWEANQALDRGECLGVRFVPYNPLAHYWLIRHRGNYCW